MQTIYKREVVKSYTGINKWSGLIIDGKFGLFEAIWP